ncbi:hypothetical protein [Streptomyces rutgersensis]|uniref:hypothetical protein n=1 Tax=Streptomyces rutgersensis TaxID=53451 RepID=UPI0021566917|nr:hypothetical protein [Streptomyces rutgersensis]
MGRPVRQTGLHRHGRLRPAHPDLRIHRPRVLDFTVSQNPAEQGYQAVKTLHDFLTEETKITGVDTGAQIITRDNLADATVED